MAAQTVELLSVLATGEHRLSKPREIPRPDWLTPAPKQKRYVPMDHPEVAFVFGGRVITDA